MAIPHARLAPAFLGLLASLGAAQSFVVDNSVLPTTLSFRSEEVELIDVDLDGDLDAFLAKGGEMTGVEEALWINQGGLQGGILGIFVDESAARIPLIDDSSTDIDLIDIDGDGDLDTHTTNTDFGWDKVPSRWGVNVGGLQGGALGYFVDETAQRWVGLAGPGSTITTSQLVAGGGWTDSSYTAAFADLDNDGDLDLVHSTYKSNHPVRLFLNDGLGFFIEHNPAGTVTTTGHIPEGSTAVWCEGIQQEDTTDASGAFCDIVLRSTDIDVADVDGDLDIDIVPSDWTGYQQRLFASRLDASALAPATSGGLVFRDVTSLSLPLVVAGISPVCAELGDLDRDGDVDLYGGNWAATSGVSFEDAVFENIGSGAFGPGMTVLSSVAVDNDVAFLDFDSDGDLDVSIAAVNGNRIYRNDGGFQLTLEPLVGTAANKLDTGMGDTDGDGDTDLLFPRISKEEFQRNITGTQDLWSPWFPVLESIPDRQAGPGFSPVRAHVLDNDSWMRTRFAKARIESSVDGVELPPTPASWAGAQVFRAELPANLVGLVRWRYVATDEHENTGSSGWQSFTASFAGTYQVPYGTATAGLGGGAPALRLLSVPFAESVLHVALSSNAPSGTPAVIGVGTLPLNPGVHLPGLLFLQVAGQVLAVVPKPLDSGGDAVLSAPLGTTPPGLTAYAQGFVLDPTAGGEVFASSKGLAITTH